MQRSAKNSTRPWQNSPNRRYQRLRNREDSLSRLACDTKDGSRTVRDPSFEASASPSLRLFRRDERLQLGRGALQDLDHFRHVRRVSRTVHRDVHVRPAERRHRLVRGTHLFAEDRGADLGEPVDDLIHGALVLGEMLASGVGYGIDLLAALLDGGARETHLLKQRERRIDGARTGRVASARPFLQLLDDVVAVPRLLVEQAKDHELEASLLEHAPAAPVAASPMATRKEERAEIRVGTPVPAPAGSLVIARPAVTIRHDESSMYDIAMILR